MTLTCLGRTVEFQGERLRLPVYLDHHATTTEQEHRTQLLIVRHANDDLYSLPYHLLHRHAGDRSPWSVRRRWSCGRTPRARYV